MDMDINTLIDIRVFFAPVMVDVSDPALAQAYADVRNDAKDTSYAVFGYTPDNKRVVLTESGTGSWSDFVSHLNDNECQFGFVRVTTGDAESKRAKFVFVSWVGKEVGALKRAKVSVHKASVKTVVRDYAAEIHAEDREELNEDLVMNKVKKAGGANYGSGN